MRYQTLTQQHTPLHLPYRELLHPLHQQKECWCQCRCHFGIWSFVRGDWSQYHPKLCKNKLLDNSSSRFEVNQMQHTAWCSVDQFQKESIMKLLETGLEHTANTLSWVNVTLNLHILWVPSGPKSLIWNWSSLKTVERILLVLSVIQIEPFRRFL